MKHAGRFGLGVACTGLVMAIACAQPAPPPPTPSPTPNPVERGKYIVATSACMDCHTPTKMGPNGPEPDMDRMLSGHPETVKITKGASLDPKGPWMAAASATFTAWSGPWGISFTANLTPDKNTGLGNWTEQMFIDTIRKGKHMGTSRDLLPPMPWPVFKNWTDEDIKAVWAYLQTIPAVSNHVPDPIPPAGAPAAPKK
jgi:hypothetical protein